ncbi:hypothetical protein CDL15_Pgr024397 [Punica granatum]|uniref:Uncharacterized protein n=1 Tax=Punica granatum TaxID=22663 RepID=A0A218XYH2_PUNGR|nr:hypothetical protein CDL15_Pgr024397 [Punica granatum]
MAGVAASHAVLTLSSLRKIGTFSSIRIAAEIRVLGRACCQYTPSLTEAYEDLFCINVIDVIFISSIVDEESPNGYFSKILQPSQALTIRSKFNPFPSL